MSPATTGDALLTPAQVLELGIRATHTDERRVVLELEHEDAERVLRRPIGGTLSVCRTCQDTRGVRVVLPKSYLEQHDLEEHRDLWIRGRNLAEAEAIKRRATQLTDRKALPSGDR